MGQDRTTHKVDDYFIVIRHCLILLTQSNLSHLSKKRMNGPLTLHLVIKDISTKIKAQFKTKARYFNELILLLSLTVSN